MSQLPESFLQQMSALLPQEECAALCDALQTTPPVSIRRNPRKMSELAEGATRVPWTTEGYYLPSRPKFTFDPLLHAGSYYVQEAASMFVEQAFRQMDLVDLMLVVLC